MTEAAGDDSLFGCLSSIFCSPIDQAKRQLGMEAVIFGHVTHSQTVIKLPEQAVLLVSNEFEPHHAFKLNNDMYGVPFHPEFTAEINHAYIGVPSEK